LEIEPTADIAVVKRAYRAKALIMHPDKNKDDPQATAKFQDLLNVYGLVDDEEKLAQYYAAFQSKTLGGASSYSASVSSSSSRESECVSPSFDSMVPLRKGMMDVYIPVSIRIVNREENHSPLSENDFVQHFDFLEIFSAISGYAKAGCLVGLSRAEAYQIIFQHKQRCQEIIVKVSVEVSDVTDERMSEKDLSNMINAKNGKFFYLRPGAVVTLSSIKEVKLVDRQNDREVIKNTDINTFYFPSNAHAFEAVAHLVLAPDKTAPLPLTSSSTVVESKQHVVLDFSRSPLIKAKNITPVSSASAASAAAVISHSSSKPPALPSPVSSASSGFGLTLFGLFQSSSSVPPSPATTAVARSALTDQSQNQVSKPDSENDQGCLVM